MIETHPALTRRRAGTLLVLAILVPVAGILLSFVARRAVTPNASRLVLTPVGLAMALAIADSCWRSGAPLVYNVGGLPPPLGIALACRRHFRRHAGDGGRW